VVAIAGGLGSFEPRKPLIEELISMKIRESSISSKIQKNLEIRVVSRVEEIRFRLEYFLDRCRFRGNIDSPSYEFRGALDSVEKVQDKDAGKSA
jgi:thioredoxin reductase (NADPH)